MTKRGAQLVKEHNKNMDKSNDKITSKSKATRGGSSGKKASDTREPAVTSSIMPIKRGRGRPRKHPRPEEIQQPREISNPAPEVENAHGGAAVTPQTIQSTDHAMMPEGSESITDHRVGETRTMNLSSARIRGPLGERMIAVNQSHITPEGDTIIINEQGQWRITEDAGTEEARRDRQSTLIIIERGSLEEVAGQSEITLNAQESGDRKSISARLQEAMEQRRQSAATVFKEMPILIHTTETWENSRIKYVVTPPNPAQKQWERVQQAMHHARIVLNPINPDLTVGLDHEQINSDLNIPADRLEVLQEQHAEMVRRIEQWKNDLAINRRTIEMMIPGTNVTLKTAVFAVSYADRPSSALPATYARWQVLATRMSTMLNEGTLLPTLTPAERTMRIRELRRCINCLPGLLGQRLHDSKSSIPMSVITRAEELINEEVEIALTLETEDLARWLNAASQRRANHPPLPPEIELPSASSITEEDLEMQSEADTHEEEADEETVQPAAPATITLNVHRGQIGLPELVSHVTSWIQTERPEADEAQISQALCSLLSMGFATLSGPPGSGKSSLWRMISEALGATFHQVNIDPEWASPQEAIGTGDAIDRRKLELGPIGEAMIQAAMEPDQLHILMLDEINLSQPEQYMSSLLGTVDQSLAERQFQIVPRNTASRLEGSHNSPEEAVKQWKGMIPWGENLLICATANDDATTQSLSERMLDRCAVMPGLRSPTMREMMNSEMSRNRQNEQRTPLSIEPKQIRKARRYGIASSEASTVLCNLDDDLVGLGYSSASARALKATMHLCNLLELSEAAINPEQCADLAAEARILPRLLARAANCSPETQQRQLRELEATFTMLGMQRCTDQVRNALRHAQERPH